VAVEVDGTGSSSSICWSAIMTFLWKALGRSWN